MPKLDDELYQTLLAISQRADALIGRGACAQGAQLYREALDLLPQPLEQWHAATWLSGSAANALFFDRQYHAAISELRRTFRFPDALANPLLRLRLGQCLLEIGDTERARQELLSAYMIEGETIFEGEHPKYLAAIEDLR